MSRMACGWRTVHERLRVLWRSLRGLQRCRKPRNEHRTDERMSRLYEVLGVTSDAAHIDIKRAYRKLALQYHPDKVTDDSLRAESEIRFKEVTAAYEILGDEEARARYDMYGDEQFGGHDEKYGAQFGEDAFMNFFHNFNMDSQEPMEDEGSRSQDVEVPLDVSMADCYNGKTFKFNSKRKIICDVCEGSGWRRRNGHVVVPPSVDCGLCGGRGYKQRIRSLAPGFAATETVKCTRCGGQGKYSARPTAEKSKCKKCRGEGLVSETKTLSVSIPRGSKNDDHIVLNNEADQAVGKAETGDLIFTVREGTSCPEHVDLQRCGSDMITHLKISLAEAIAGFKRTLTKTLDGRVLELEIPAGKVIRPGNAIKIEQEGWPLNEKATKFGDLYVVVHIEFPPDNWFAEKADILQIKNILPGGKLPDARIEDDPYNSERVTNMQIIDCLPKLISNNLNASKTQTSDDFTSAQCPQQ